MSEESAELRLKRPLYRRTAVWMTVRQQQHKLQGAPRLSLICDQGAHVCGNQLLSDN